MWGRPASWQTTIAVGWAPWSSPSDTPANEGCESEPWPSITSQPSSSRAGESRSAAPEMKSAITASIGTPLSAMKMPVWPVARKSAASPRSRNPCASASDAYILPTEQSVPTVSSRAPGAAQALADGEVGGRVADVEQRHAAASAAAATSGIARSRWWRPEATSSPAAIAASTSSTIAGPISPPALAMPITSVRAPAAFASAKPSCGRPSVSGDPGRAYSPRARSGRHTAMPREVLMSIGSRVSPR